MATLKRLRDMIRMQANIKGMDTMTGVIDNLINEVLTEYTARAMCPEMLQYDAVFTSDGPGTNTFAGNNDIQHLLKDRVFYGNSTDGRTLAIRLYESSLMDGSNIGTPIKFQWVGGGLFRVFPYTAVQAIDQLWVDYYKTPTPLVNDTDTFPVPSLEQTVKLEVIARLARYGGNPAMSKDFKEDAMQGFSAYRAQQGR